MGCKCKQCKCSDSLSELISIIDDDTKPFSEEILNDNFKIRHFSQSAPGHLFKWHWDEEDRWIESLTVNDWLFQFDDDLPQPLEKGKIIFIPMGYIHRIIKGTKPLSILIKT